MQNNSVIIGLISIILLLAGVIILLCGNQGLIMA